MSDSSTELKNCIDMLMTTAPIIKIALAMGVLAFAVIAILMGHAPEKGPDMMLVWMMAGMGVATFIARLIVPGVLVAKGRTSIAAGTWIKNPPGYPPTPSSDEGKLATLYQTQMIIGSAFLEGGAFANVFAYMTQKHPISLGVAAILWIGLLIDFPTRFRVTSWIDRQLRLVRDEQPLARRDS